MAFVKTTEAEKVEPVSRKGGEAIRAFVRKTGKVSASQLTDKERANLPQED